MNLPVLLRMLLSALFSNLMGLMLVSARAQNNYNPNQNYLQSMSNRYPTGQNRYDDGRGGYSYDSRPNVYGTYTTGYYNQPSAQYGYDTNSAYYNSGYYSTPGQVGYSNYGNSGYNGYSNNNDYNNNNNRYGYSSSSYLYNSNRPWDSNNRGNVYTTTPYYDRSSGYYNDRYNAAPGPIVRIKAIPQTAWSMASMIKVGAIALAVIMGQVALAGFFM